MLTLNWVDNAGKLSPAPTVYNSQSAGAISHGSIVMTSVAVGVMGTGVLDGVGDGVRWLGVLVMVGGNAVGVSVGKRRVGRGVLVLGAEREEAIWVTVGGRVDKLSACDNKKAVIKMAMTPKNKRMASVRLPASGSGCGWLLLTMTRRSG